MDRQALTAMRFILERQVRRLTWPWAVAAGFLAIALAVFLSMILPARHELAALHGRMSALQQQVHGAENRDAASIRNAPMSQFAVFYQAFPEESSLPDWLEKIMGAAQDSHLQLKQGDYRIAREKGGKLLRYQIKLPLSGSYLDIRRFLSAVLVDIPIASLDNVKFERQKIGDSTINATVELTLYFGRPS